MSFQKYIDLVERTIQEQGIDPATCRGEQPMQWFLRRGSATVLLFLRESQHSTGENRVVFVAISPMMEVPTDPTKRSQLAWRLLEINHQFIFERFTTAEGWVYLSSARPVDGLDSGEIVDMVESLSYYADMFDDMLQNEFGTPGAGDDNHSR